MPVSRLKPDLWILAGVINLLILFFAVEPAQSVDGFDICGTYDENNAGCYCVSTENADENGIILRVNCDALGLQLLYEDHDWKETLSSRNLTNNTEISVRFQNNKLKKITKFSQLAISELDFRHNQISEIEDSAFSLLTNLIDLDLSDNQLTAESLKESAFFGTFDEQKGYLPLSVQYLNLSYNNIHALDKDLFDHFPDLKTLDLGNNPLAVLDGGTSMSLMHLFKLESLGLSNTKISSIPAGMLNALKNIVVIDLSYNYFTQVPDELQYIDQLTSLNLDGNKIETLDSNSFKNVSTLKTLSLSNMFTLRYVGHAAFGPLIRLAKLNMSHNKKLSNISDGAFFGIAKDSNDWTLTELRLNDNGLTHIDQALAEWDRIDYIDIQNNPFWCDCNLEWMAVVLLSKIRKMYPQLVTDVTCHGPSNMAGKSLVMLGEEPEIFYKCDGPISQEMYLPGDESIPSNPSNAGGMAVLIVGLVLITIGLSILAVLLVKRRAIARSLAVRHDIRYQRAESEENIERYSAPRPVHA